MAIPSLDGLIQGPDATIFNANAGVGSGQTATITGADFQDASVASFSVKFGGNAATSVVVVDDNTITCTVPASSAGSVVVQVTVKVTYVDSSQQVLSPFLFWYYGTALRCFFTQVNSGANLGGGTRGAWTSFSGSIGTGAASSGNAMGIFHIPAAALPSGAVVAALQKQTIGPIDAIVVYTDKIDNTGGAGNVTIGTKSNTALDLTGTGSVTWTGSTPPTSTSYVVNGISSNSFIDNGLYIYVYITAPASTTFHYVYDMDSTRLYQDILYSTQTPVIDSITPNSGASGTAITIVGSFFDSDATVTFDGTTADNIVWVDANTITCDAPTHAAGLVDVKVENVSAGYYTIIADGYSYSSGASSPIVNGGAAQVVIGPAPATRTTTATVTPGTGGTPTYLWTQLSGPVSVTIATDTSLNTDITFPTYTPGTYVFQLAATTPGTGGLPDITSTGQAIFVLAPSVAPRITGGSRVISYPSGITLTPTITDDSWGGALHYAWVQVTGPGSSTIVSASSASTAITFPNTAGTYVFTLTVTRTDDALTGVGTWLVYVGPSGGALLPDTHNVGNVTMTVGGVDIPQALIDSLGWTKPLGSNPQCGFRLYNADVTRYDEVVLTRGGVRMFGGICLSTTLSYDDEVVPFRDVNLLGFAWHLSRKTFTKTYTDESVTAIVLDLLTFASGGITGDFVATGLPVVSIAFDDVYINAAYDQLANLIHASWKVDDYKKLHYAIFESTTSPMAIDSRHPWYENLSITKDAGPAVNRVVVRYLQTPQAVSVPSEITVSSPDGYNVTGGVTVINGATVTYTALESRLLSSGAAPTERHPVNGPVGIMFSVTNETSISPPGTLLQALAYMGTLVTAEGETGPKFAASSGIAFSGSQNASKIKITSLVSSDPQALARCKQMNVYRMSESGGAASLLVGSIPLPAGGAFLDYLKFSDVDVLPVSLPEFNTADNVVLPTGEVQLFQYVLTGCTGTAQGNIEATHISDDTAAQAVVAAAIGGGDDGVIQVTLQGGILTDAAAAQLADAYLGFSAKEQITVNVDVHDDLMVDGHGKSLTISLPAESISTVLKIQQVRLKGFQKGVQHVYSVIAANSRVTLDDLLKHNLNLLPKKVGV